MARSTSCSDEDPGRKSGAIEVRSWATLNQRLFHAEALEAEKPGSQNAAAFDVHKITRNPTSEIRHPFYFRFFRNCDQAPKTASSAPAVSQTAIRNSSLPLNAYAPAK